MRVLHKRKLEEFAKTHATARASLEQWHTVVTHASWASFAEVRQTYRHADIVGDKTVFNIAGNKVRLIASINYRAQVVYIEAVLTHSEYDKGRWKT